MAKSNINIKKFKNSIVQQLRIYKQKTLKNLPIRSKLHKTPEHPAK